MKAKRVDEIISRLRDPLGKLNADNLVEEVIREDNKHDFQKNTRVMKQQVYFEYAKYDKVKK